MINSMPASQYTHGGDVYSHKGSVLDFSSNINPLGLPSGVKKAIVDNIDRYAVYPDPHCRELSSAIAAHHKIPCSWVINGNGAADLIFRIALCLKPKRALIPVPTFSEYEKALDLVGCDVQKHRLQERHSFLLGEDFLDQIKKGIDILFICNPNNPTGATTDKELMLRISDRCLKCGTILVADECFLGFCDEEHRLTVMGELKKKPNVILLKAFTKTYAMAGIRLGYALSSNNTLMEGIKTTLQPWSVSTVASKCGVAALNEVDYIRKTKTLTRENREHLASSLRDLGIIVFEAAANYILFKAQRRDLEIAFLEHGVLVRSCSNFEGLSDFFYRIAVRSKEDNQYLIECLKKIMEEKRCPSC